MARFNGSTEQYSAVALSVERFVAEVRATSLPIPACRDAIGEIDYLITTIGASSPALNDALVRLRDLLRARCELPVRRTPDAIATRKLTKLLRLLGPLAAASAMASFSLASPVAAAIPVVVVGGTVFNPLTQANETIIQVVGTPGYAVRTSTGNIILLAQTVGDTFTDLDGKVQTVQSVTSTTYGSGPSAVTYVTGVTLKDAANVVTTKTVVTAIPAPPATGGDGSGGGTALLPTGPGDIGQVSDIRFGANGGNGSAGFEICVLGFCVGYPPTRGGNGAPGPTFTTNVLASHGTISIQSNNVPGIIVASVGGNGGHGGGSGGIGGSGAQGGTAGNGGNPTLNNYTNIVTGSPTDATKGINSHGIFVKSVAGSGGAGGTCYIGCSGGSGGGAAAGGNAAAYNYGNITTYGDGAVGMLVQSLGGNAGSGGSSYGIVGASGSGSRGGNGGNAYAENSGTIITNGDRAYGIQAQSVGGNGGSSGDAAGIAAFGASAGGAGIGGSAKIKLNSTSSITTYGDFAHGTIVQSIGGGGGATGWVGGAVSFGSSAGDGNVGGAAEVEALGGSYIHTLGKGSYGIFVESVGGNGGTASGTGGVFTLGGSGGTGSNGGTVTVSSGATIWTEGEDARGVFAQSVGGGGGNANASGGLVSLGGSGSAGGTGGNVNVTLTSASDITTEDDGSDGAFAQSVGGGGGTGATSGGLAALGGAGGSGGAGGVVTLSNAGQIDTGGDFSRGIFGQSVGGGGGSGGDSGGLIAIGGSGSVASAGGAVTVGNSGWITTGGNMSTGMQAQSIGGGGGDGGTSGGVLLTIGGSGAGGGAGGIVTANMSGSIATGGHDSHGLFAQSVGGGGGNGGSSTSVSAFVGLALGGSAGGGGGGGNVTSSFTQRTVDVGGVATLLDPYISTGGDRSRGVYLQSVGGGGGNGGMAVQVSAGLFAAASFAIGGSGGTGGAGGTVSSTGDVIVSTTGNLSEGFFAQSVGGGGGSGGAAISVAASVGEGVSAALSVGIGGKGGTGGAGGTVTVASGGAITTTGSYSTGFVGQSVGGGGGKGGFSVSVAGAASDGIAVSGGLGIGGSGGSGGLGGTVNASFDGAISTGGASGLGTDSAGALIQSIGGGGGIGGFNVSATIGLAGGTAVGAAVGLGGSGGTGGVGGTVTGSVGGNVTTRGARSAGVIIQSAGGGGGTGGFNVSGNINFSGGLAGGASVGLGGTGGGGGTGGTVTGSALGEVETFGAQSDGVLIQSIGGGGGSGGFNVSGGLNFGGATAVAIGVGLGGSGGGAGAGGIVTGTVSDVVVTHGDQSRGVLVQSVGGGGGAGAFNITGGLAAGGVAGGTIGVGLGGNAGGGGSANTVNASALSITTSGKDSGGFIAQSVGGGGGTGGFNVTGSLGFGGTAGGTIGVGLGGSGGSGGSAMKVTASLTGIATTGGDRSGAILAQSVGGGGGAGGFNITGGIAGANTGAGSLNIGLGGTGGTAGHGGEVALTVVGHASTDGVDSDGIIAQSVGGGGGSGGFNIAAGIAAAGTGAGQVGFGMGGRGGGGGDAQLVTLNVNNGVTTSSLTRAASVTTKDLSSGIIAQSLGGGGGNGGFNVTGGASFAGTGAGGVNVGIGGSGGAGGIGRVVIADISGYTSTAGDDSIGILAQSVGGGGGNGNFNVAGGLTIGGTGSGMINVGVGGSGGNGGTAGNVTLRINDQILTPSQSLVAAVTEGDRSGGIMAQSLGGGGGNGGFNVTGGINLAGTASGGANIGVGGMGGDGGFAGDVLADITGGIGTEGEHSTALLVQSIGGGGGNGGFNVSGTLSIAKSSGAFGVGIGGFGGDGGASGEARLDLNQRTTDTANTLAAVSTVDDDSAGIVVQSLGGGGGNGGFNVTGSMSFAKGGAGNIGVGVGGFGGDGGDAAKTTANVRGDILTGGDRSGALLVQSLGGGGGNGGFNVTAGITASKAANGNLGIGIGGFGGGGGDGKTVFATIQSDIQTSGIDSYGASIQSIGGGGGNGAFNVTGGISASFGTSASGNLGVGIGGFGGDGGHADEVTASLTGNISTAGLNSHGVMVQSAGGGGGSGGFNVTGGISVTKGASGSVGVGVGGFGGDGGDGEKVTATLIGNILTTDDESFGATFQSLGGGGGNGAFNVTGGINISLGTSASGNLNVGIGGFAGGGGDGGQVIGTLTGNILTGGDNSHGALLQSIGGGGGNGGMNVTGGVAMSKGTTGTVGFGLGGFGGDGGDAGTIDGTLAGNVTTSGANSYGAMFQSLGGAGGTGGLNVAGGINITKGDATSGGAAIGIGGFGGGGGDGMRVTAAATGLYHTDGVGSAGVIAQSVGGGGGAGGLNVAGSIGVSTQGNGGGAALGLGGFGGDGGSAGNVTLTRVGQTVTLQGNSNGVVAQSVGGGGGTGALSVAGGIAGSNTGNSGTFVLGIGGFGGGGGAAGTVTATVRDSVWATGSDAASVFYPDDFVYDDGHVIEVGAKTHLLNGSHGIVVQSLGGGGGSGGMNISGGISLTKQSEGSTGSALVLGVGGFGGSGGDGNIVNATVGATSGPRIQVQSQGDAKAAVYAGSIGGSGGDGAINISGGITTDGQVVAGFGGGGSGGGLGAAVTATVDANLFASGHKASGLTVQSLGGGGGYGGINISGGLKPRVGTEPVITFGMGGNGGVGNSSGNVIAHQDGQVIVDGYTSTGILVQSIAGGGGSGGMDIVANVNRSNGDSKLDGFAAGIGIGGSGGSGGTAGTAFLRSTGDVLVNTVVTPLSGGLSAGSQAGFSAGITVQSIGGGGGVGGFNFVGVIAPKGNPMTIAVGGSGGVGGDAADVTVRRGYRADGSVSRSLINTFGAGSAGLIAQSIGGGGGNAGTNLAFALGSTKANETGFGGQFIIGGSGESSGDGKAVTVDHVGSIQTDGYGSDGLLAQSIGKGGGNAALNIGFTKLGGDSKGHTSTVNGFSLALGGAAGDAGSAGIVTVDHDGTIITKQAMSSGIVAQSLAGGGGNTALNLGVLTGADNVLKLSIGREGGSGGIAGDVFVTSTGALLATGQMSNGIVAQSIGGAGGLSGTISVEGGMREGSGSNASTNGFGVSVGLEGGAGGHSGAVTVDNAADIQTDGEEARGIIAQSIGGDGGVAGSGRVITTGQKDSLAVAVGGGGGSGATSSKVTVGNSALIITKGKTSDGILAQSIGGGGGVAGSASTIKAPTGGLEQKSASTLAVAVGGSGGDGAVAGDVEVTNDGIISTEQDASYGIRAQSIGGGGGVGGATYNIEMQKAESVNTLNVLVGGGGGSGQLAGRVDVFNNGLIMTTGIGSSGISANSIGGGGGDAGSVSSITILKAQPEGQTNAFALAIGGGGGSGGAGGSVNVVNAPTVGVLDSGTIFTSNSTAHGIFAQSLGGGGGNGSSILSITGSNGAKDSISVGLNIGGKGGSANVGGEVTVDNQGIIRTEGEGSIGILAQSIGGGGGNGGLVLTANILMKSKDKSPLISIGGVGGAGNDGGHVSVTNSGRIITLGKNADGIVAQSIGGGGGSAGMGLALTGDVKTLVASNLMALLVGAIGGGNSGVGGEVDVVHSGDITVLGEGSQAIVAESINGGGGSIHFDMSGIAMPSIGAAIPEVAIPPLGELDGIPNLVKGEPSNRPVDPVIVAARVGASDATSMNAGKVTISISGTIGAGGNYGAGATIRSVGGGGGALTISGTLVTPEPPPAGSVTAQAIYAVGLGAKNSDDSSGADIESTHTGETVTSGIASTGVLIQSIGGGGGTALVDLEVDDPTMVDSVRLGLGAVGTSNSHGGAVNRTQNGAVFTTNHFSHGALVQSIGGGGGLATAHIGLIAPAAGAAASIAGTQQLAGWQESALFSQALLADEPTPTIVSLGATGGTGNDGAVVDLSFTGGFYTEGDHANGLVAQSIGGGGGAAILDGLGAVSIILGGQAGAEGSGGDVLISNNGQVVTLGEAANGILLQSIGGGGGAVFGAGADASLTLSSANSGDGGAIGLAQTGHVEVHGANTYGILAQSLGGGGGYVDGLFAGTAGGTGMGGLINLTIYGQVYAPGAGSIAIGTQSLGSLGGSNITIDGFGQLRGGSGSGVAVLMDGGHDNLLTSHASLSAVSGLAVLATSGNDSVVNEGLAIGNFILGGGTNALLNNATLVTIDTMDLLDGIGSTGTFTNAGDLYLGLQASPYPIDLLGGETFPIPVSADPLTDLFYGTRVISQVALDGDIVQTGTGHSVFDVAFGPYDSDRFDVTGDATVDGTMDVTLTWLENSDPVTLMATDGVGVDLGLEVTDTLAMDYFILDGDIGIQLAFETNFGLPFLTPNQQAMGGHLDSAVEVGGAGGIGQLLALLGNLSAGQEDIYQSIMAELDPELFITPVVAQLGAAREFGSDLFGCGTQRKNPDAICVSGGVAHSSFDRDSSRGDFAFRESDTARLRVGVEVPMGNGWSVGAALGYDDIGRFTFDTDRAEGNGEAVHGGIGIRKLLDPDGRGAASLQVTAGTRSNDVARRQSIFVDGIGRSHYRTTYAGVSADIGYSFGDGKLFARPALHLSMYNIGNESFTERGLDGLGVDGLERHSWVGTANPQLTVGTTVGGIGKFSVTGGYVVHSKSRLYSPFRLIGADDSSDPAMIYTRFDKSAWKLGGHLGVAGSDRISLDLGYDTEFGDSIEAHSVKGKLKVAF